MDANTATVGDYTLTISMATLYRADKELKKAGLPPVMASFLQVLPAFQPGADLSKVDLSALDFEMFVTFITALLYPAHKLTQAKALDGPLSQGSPRDWLMPVFSLLMENSPQSGDVEDDDAGEDADAVGNDRTA